MSELTQALKLFYCYASKDRDLRDELDKHLFGLRRQQLITTWHNGEVLPGSWREKEIDAHLSTAHLILLLVSPDFLTSDYCYEVEMKHALARHQNGTACVIPIIVRPFHWNKAPFSHLQVLPTNKKPVTSWSNRDEAWSDIAKGIDTAVQALMDSLEQTKKEQRLEDSKAFLEFKHDEQIMVAYNRTTQSGHSNSLMLRQRSAELNALERYEEALEFANQAILLDPTDSVLFRQKSIALNALERYEEALEAVDQAILFNPTDSFLFRQKGIALNTLERYEEALEAVIQAILLDPTDGSSFGLQSFTLNVLERYEEALEAANQAILLNPTDSFSSEQKSDALKGLRRQPG